MYQSKYQPESQLASLPAQKARKPGISAVIGGKSLPLRHFQSIVIETAELQALQDVGNAPLVQKGGTVGLKVASPLRRGTKIYFRKAVPKDLQKILGKAEIKHGLRTTDEEAARPDFARLNAEWEQRFQSLRRGHTPLSRKDAAALAGEMYKEIVGSNEDNPRSQRAPAWSGCHRRVPGGGSKDAGHPLGQPGHPRQDGSGVAAGAAAGSRGFPH